jgi:hypothetical protein
MKQLRRDGIGAMRFEPPIDRKLLLLISELTPSSLRLFPASSKLSKGRRLFPLTDFRQSGGSAFQHTRSRIARDRGYPRWLMGHGSFSIQCLQCGGVGHLRSASLPGPKCEGRGATR